ncbi:MAG: bifunctional serine/threonine-protein kinase/formylglycine-generating enzyme family protein [Acidobacteriota bacterium]|nr:bifunctional serine/threonine-protein kinase/formylglycine-generating enzyme family protein [Acidobacteriota bacterium]
MKSTINGDPVLDGRYQLERRIGQGGMGVVFKARHIFLKTQHAIKIILPDLVGNDPSLITRFRQEAMAAAAIRHPNIIAVTDFGVVNNTMPFLVMEFVQGRSLHDILAEEGRLAPARALEIITGVAAGLGEAHRQGIVHRDLKPLNIMLRDGLPAGEGVKLLDFGLAKIKSGELLGSFVAAQTTGLMGSPFYMAPEQWSDEEPDARADLYSLGIIFYQMLAGTVPFKGASIPSIMKKHLTSPPPGLVEHGVSVPSAFEDVLRSALEKEADKRPATVELFISSLREAVINSGPIVILDSQQRDAASNVSPATLAIGRDTGDQVAGLVSSEDVGGSTRAGTDGTLTDLPAAPKQGAISRDTKPPEPLSAEAERDLRSAQTEVFSIHQTAPNLTAEEKIRRLAAEHSHQRDSSQRVADQRIENSAPQSSVGDEVARADAEERAGVEEARRREAELFRQQSMESAIWPRSESSVQIPIDTSLSLPPPPLAASSSAAFGASGSSVTTLRTPRTILLVAAAVVALALVGGALGLLIVKLAVTDNDTPPAISNSSNRAGASVNANARPVASPSGASSVTATTRPDLIALPGGTFQMGRNDVPPPRDSSIPVAYRQWVYNQWPAHSVTVRPFAIDRTEVTNAEYAEFVRVTAYPPPPDWPNNNPRAGQEQWPVRNVTLEDAQRFANWRSQRDKVKYRLPTEEEWEYAARGGQTSRLYPWNGQWREGAANLDSATLKPVGSHPDGHTSQGVADMIGNVWEWTSTVATMYKGNNVLGLVAGDMQKAVVRGGSYQSSAQGDEPITATARRWVDKEKRDPVIGFRLARENP